MNTKVLAACLAAVLGSAAAMVEAAQTDQKAQKDIEEWIIRLTVTKDGITRLQFNNFPALTREDLSELPDGGWSTQLPILCSVPDVPGRCCWKISEPGMPTTEMKRNNKKIYDATQGPRVQIPLTYPPTPPNAVCGNAKYG